MIYLLFGKQPLMIKKRLQNLLKTNQPIIDDFSVINFDYEKDDLEDILLAIETLPFLYDKKSIVITNANFLKTKLNEKNAPLLTAIQKDNPAVDVYFIYENDDISMTNEIVTYIKEHGKISELSNLKAEDWPIYVKKFFKDKGITIEDKAVTELVKRVEGNLYRFVNEANKLMLCCTGNNITLLDVTTMVKKPLEDDVFQLVNALYRKDNALALLIYRDLKLMGHGLVDNLVSLLGTQFRFIAEVSHLYERGFDYARIAGELKCHDYRVKMALKNKGNISNDELANILRNLFLLDFQTKSGLIDRDYAIELFIINFPKYPNLFNA